MLPFSIVLLLSGIVTVLFHVTYVGFFHAVSLPIVLCEMTILVWVVLDGLRVNKKFIMLLWPTSAFHTIHIYYNCLRHWQWSTFGLLWYSFAFAVFWVWMNRPWTFLPRLPFCLWWAMPCWVHSLIDKISDTVCMARTTIDSLQMAGTFIDSVQMVEDSVDSVQKSNWMLSLILCLDPTLMWILNSIYTLRYFFGYVRYGTIFMSIFLYCSQFSASVFCIATSPSFSLGCWHYIYRLFTLPGICISFICTFTTSSCLSGIPSCYTESHCSWLTGKIRVSTSAPLVSQTSTTSTDLLFQHWFYSLRPNFVTLLRIVSLSASLLPIGNPPISVPVSLVSILFLVSSTERIFLSR